MCCIVISPTMPPTFGNCTISCGSLSANIRETACDWQSVALLLFANCYIPEICKPSPQGFLHLEHNPFGDDLQVDIFTRFGNGLTRFAGRDNGVSGSLYNTTCQTEKAASSATSEMPFPVPVEVPFFVIYSPGARAMPGPGKNILSHFGILILPISVASCRRLPFFMVDRRFLLPLQTPTIVYINSIHFYRYLLFLVFFRG
jgi:hypothetical protein